MIHVVNNFVQIVVPVHGILVLKVGSTGPHLMIRLGMGCLTQRILDKLVNNFVNVVVVSTGIVLYFSFGVVVSNPGSIAATSAAVQLTRKDLS